MKRRRLLFEENKTIDQSEAETKDLQDSAYSESTLRLVKYSVDLYEEWRARMKIESEPMFPLNTGRVCCFLNDLKKAGFKTSTIKTVIIRGLKNESRRKHHINPNTDLELMDKIKETMLGMKKKFPDQESDIKRLPLLNQIIYALVDRLGETPFETRTKALLLFNSTLGCRCDSLSALKMSDLDFNARKDSIKVTIRKDKNKNLDTRTRFVDAMNGEILSKYCPYAAIIQYLTAIEALQYQDGTPFIKSELKDKPLFVAFDYGIYFNEYKPVLPKNLSESISRLAQQHGYNKGQITGHSMRKGFATQFTINKIFENTATVNIRHSLCHWVGWDPNSKVVDGYINEVVDWVQNMTNDIHQPHLDKPKFLIENHPSLLPPNPVEKVKIRKLSVEAELAHQAALRNATTKEEKTKLHRKRSAQIRKDTLKEFSELGDNVDWSGKLVGITSFDDYMKTIRKERDDYYTSIGLDPSENQAGRHLNLTEKQKKKMTYYRSRIGKITENWKILYISKIESKCMMSNNGSSG